MLIRFEVENFKAFKERIVFDMSNIKNYEFNSECVQNGIVKNGIIYGKNGCGKSNLGLAIFDIVAHLTDKQSDAKFYENYLHADLPKETAKFTYVFKFNDSIVEYTYEKTEASLAIVESLKINNKEVVKYSVGSPLITSLKGTESLKKDITDSKISALKYIRSNAVLNKGKTNDMFSKFFDFIDSMLFFRSVEVISYIGYEKGSTSILQDIVEKGHMADFEEFLNTAGISCKLAPIELNGNKSIGFSFSNVTLQFWDIASSGTKSLSLFYFWLQRLNAKGAWGEKGLSNEKGPSFVFIDEFDANYHHELAALIVDLLKSVKAQVILTTHDTTLMSNELMRPDCCFLMENSTITPFSNLTEKELRFAHNIEKMYKAGAFGG